MDVGLSVYDIPGAELVALGAAAEQAGFSTLWLGEHIVLPVDYEAEHPTTGSESSRSHLKRIIDPATKLLDPLVALSAVAAVTERIRLATGIYLVGLRHPLAVARMTLTLQDIAGGRFMLGVGSGWLEEEFAALDVPFAQRRVRFEEALAVLRAAWAGGEISFAGDHVAFEHVIVTAEAVHVPLILGGNTEPALRRRRRRPTAGSARATRRSRRRCACGRASASSPTQRGAARRSRCTCGWPVATGASSIATPSTASST